MQRDHRLLGAVRRYGRSLPREELRVVLHHNGLLRVRGHGHGGGLLGDDLSPRDVVRQQAVPRPRVRLRLMREHYAVLAILVVSMLSRLASRVQRRELWLLREFLPVTRNGPETHSTTAT